MLANGHNVTGAETSNGSEAPGTSVLPADSVNQELEARRGQFSLPPGTTVDVYLTNLGRNHREAPQGDVLIGTATLGERRINCYTAGYDTREFTLILIAIAPLARIFGQHHGIRELVEEDGRLMRLILSQPQAKLAFKVQVDGRLDFPEDCR